MGRDYAIRHDLKEIGLPERTVRVLEKAAQLVDLIEEQAALTDSVTAINTAVDALQEADEDAALSLASLDTRIDHFEALEPFVRQDQGAAWTAPAATAARTALPAYSAAVISNPPTQAEVQAISTQLAAVTAALAGVIIDGQGNGALT